MKIFICIVFCRGKQAFFGNVKKDFDMGFLELFLIAVGLSMDAFAVAICKGLSVRKLKLSHMLITGAYFGVFQAVMPLIGYYLGQTFESYITSFDHWIAFVLLSLIGANMIRESFSKEENEYNASFSFKTMLPLAVATSIDALAVGVTFGLMQGVYIFGCRAYRRYDACSFFCRREDRKCFRFEI